MIETMIQLTDSDSIITICNSVECSVTELKIDRNSGIETYIFPSGRLYGSFSMRRGDYFLEIHGNCFVTRKIPIRNKQVKND